jgi:hypothetical protein
MKSNAKKLLNIIDIPIWKDAQGPVKVAAGAVQARDQALRFQDVHINLISSSFFRNEERILSYENSSNAYVSLSVCT